MPARPLPTCPRSAPPSPPSPCHAIQALDEGFTQVVCIAAGFDTRAYRFYRAGVKVRPGSGSVGPVGRLDADALLLPLPFGGSVTAATSLPGPWTRCSSLK